MGIRKATQRVLFEMALGEFISLCTIYCSLLYRRTPLQLAAHMSRWQHHQFVSMALYLSVKCKLFYIPCKFMHFIYSSDHSVV